MNKPRRWTPLRRSVQLAVALLYLVLPFLNRWGLRGFMGNLASLKVGPVDLLEPAVALSVVLAAGKITASLVLALLPVVALAVVLGPVFCSWVCPWGLLSEGLDYLKIRTLHLHRTWTAEGYRKLRPLRMAALLVFLLASSVVASPLVALLAPPRLVTALPQELFYLSVRPVVTGSVLLLWLLAELFLPRRWVCRALCPVGALWNFLRLPWTLQVRFEPTLCVDPKVAPCHLHCPWGIDPRSMGRFDGCTNCLRCVEGCPSTALRAGFGKPMDPPVRTKKVST